MRSTLVVWLKPSQEAWHRHHSVARQSAAEPNTRDGTHWRQQFRRTRVIATGPRAREGGPQATQNYVAGGFDMDGTRTSRVQGPHLMSLPWMTYSNASQPGKKYSRSWQEHTLAQASMCWAYSITPWESTGRTGNRPRLTRSCERISYGASCRPSCIHRTAGSRGDRASLWW